MPNKMILVVDDTPEILELLAEALAPLGHNVRTASNGKDAWKLVAAEHFDLVVSDIRMPGMDGLELLACMKEAGVLSPTIMLTGYGCKESILRAWQLGAFDFFEKPFDQERLLRIARVALEVGWDYNEHAPLHGRMTKSAYQTIPLQIEKPLYVKARAHCNAAGKSISTLIHELLREKLR